MAIFQAVISYHRSNLSRRNFAVTNAISLIQIKSDIQKERMMSQLEAR